MCGLCVRDMLQKRPALGVVPIWLSERRKKAQRLAQNSWDVKIIQNVDLRKAHNKALGDRYAPVSSRSPDMILRGCY